MRVRVENVLRDPRSGQPVVLLSDMHRTKGMLIWIGEYEAQALRAAMMDVQYPRPLTHDLLMGVLKELGAKMLELRITELKENVFYSKLILKTDNGIIEVDSRPSDGMVLAIRSKCPIFVSASLFEKQAMELSISGLESYGLGLQELSDDLREALQYQGGGVLVSQVEPDSVAEKDGLRPKDIIMEAAGRAIERVEDFKKALEKARGGPLRVKVHREGKELSLLLHP
jgi:hypothetical protein